MTVRARADPLLGMLGTVAAAVGCLLPWETLSVTAGGASSATPVGALHGTGILACAGASVALLALAARLWRPGAAPAWESLETLAGTLLVLGVALFTVRGGAAPGAGPGWSVTLGPGLALTAAGGVAILAGAALAALGRRATGAGTG
jgi:hypothetical protein